MRILLTRPEPDASRMRAELETRGHSVSIDPLLTIEPCAIEADAFAGAQALIATSRNALRALATSPALSAARQLPLFAVGPGTEELARTLAFQQVVAAAGGARDLVARIAAVADPAGGALVHVAGEAVAFDLAAALAERGFRVRTLTAYRARAAATLSPATIASIRAHTLDAVVLMSPRSAETFAQLVADAGLGDEARLLVFLCLSPAVAGALQRLAPVRTEVADAPNSEAILAAVTRVATRGPGV